MEVAAYTLLEGLQQNMMKQRGNMRVFPVGCDRVHGACVPAWSMHD